MKISKRLNFFIKYNLVQKNIFFLIIYFFKDIFYLSINLLIISLLVHKNQLQLEKFEKKIKKINKMFFYLIFLRYFLSVYQSIDNKYFDTKN